MTEDEAQSIVRDRFGAEAVDQISDFLAQVVAENTRQNLMAPSTIPDIWTRHALDSLQLVDHARAGDWLDIGTGGGFPGFVVALVRPQAMTLVEPRKRRAAFLAEMMDRFAIADRVTVIQANVDRLERPSANISARAVASIENLLRAARHCATPETRWILPRGRIDLVEIAAVQRNWRFVFHVEQSLTDADSSILLLDQVTAR